MANLLQSLHLAPAISKVKVIYNGVSPGTIFPFGLEGATILRLPTGDVSVSAVWATMGITVSKTEILEGNISITVPSHLPPLDAHISEVALPLRAVMAQGQVHYYEPILQVSLSGGKPQFATTLDSVVADSIIITPARSSVTGTITITNGSGASAIDLTNIRLNRSAFDFTVRDLYDGNVISVEPDLEWALADGLVFSLGIPATPTRLMSGQKASADVIIRDSSFSWVTRLPHVTGSDTVVVHSQTVIILQLVVADNGLTRTDNLSALLEESVCWYQLSVKDRFRKNEDSISSYILLLQPHGKENSFHLEQSVITHLSVVRSATLNKYALQLYPPSTASSDYYAQLSKDNSASYIEWAAATSPEHVGSAVRINDVSMSINSRIRSTVHNLFKSDIIRMIPNKSLTEAIIYSTDLKVDHYEVAILGKDSSDPIVLELLSDGNQYPALSNLSSYVPTNQALRETASSGSRLASMKTLIEEAAPITGICVVSADLKYLVEPSQIVLYSDPSSVKYLVDPPTVTCSEVESGNIIKINNEFN